MTEQNKSEMKSISGSKGLLFIFKVLENFFEQMLKYFRDGEKDKEDLAIQILFKRIREGRKLVKKGSNIIKDIQKDLNSLNTVLNNIPLLDSSFKKAEDGLKNVNYVAEEAAIKIQDASVSIQDSLDKVNKYLIKLESPDKFDSEKKETLKSCIKEISSVADTTSNIMTTLQFQDILRQQLSAIGILLSKTKIKIAKSIEKIEGLPVEVDESDEYFVAADVSILDKQESQDEIDSIISKVKNHEKD